ncbi:MAG: hypothetical protein WKF42_08005 [Solirubrobacteraceae bacterium]
MLPIVALLAGIVALLSLVAPPIDLPSVDLPSVRFPDITPPGWLRAIAGAVAWVFGLLADASRYVVPALLLMLGVRRTREVRRKRREAEQIGRTELMRRLAVVLGTVEATTRRQHAATISDAPTPGQLSPRPGHHDFSAQGP